MNKMLESFSAKSIVMAGAVSMMLLAGCSSEKVLTERPYIPAPSDQVSNQGLTALSPISNGIVQPIPDLPPFQEPKIEAITYKVQKGDSLWKIARMHGVSMQELAAFNNMDLKSTLKVGTTLRIPPGGTPMPPEKLAKLKTASSKEQKNVTKSAKEPLPTDGVYAVKSGDSLWKIAKKFDMTVDQLASINNLDTKAPLQVGQKIKVSDSAQITKQETKPVSISRETKTTVEEPPVQLDIPVSENMEMEGLEDVINEEDMKSLNADMQNTALPTPSIKSGPMLEELKGTTIDVAPGDTWQSIANVYGVSVSELKKANPSVTTPEPAPGTKIVVPDHY